MASSIILENHENVSTVKALSCSGKARIIECSPCNRTGSYFAKEEVLCVII